MKLLPLSLACACILFSGVAVAAAPTIPPDMVKACVMDDTPDSGTVNEVLVEIGALAKPVTPKIKVLDVRKSTDPNDASEYEFTAALDYGKVKAIVMVGCLYDPTRKPAASGSLVGMLMTEPTMFVYSMPTNGQPPSADGNRGKLWKQFMVKAYSNWLIDHQL
jgi:hypothetical protein